MSAIYYQLSPDIKVRQESFGLLFYNTRNTNLTFIKSGSLIRVETLEKESPDSDYLDRDGETNQKIQGILHHLVKRGLLRAETKSS
ncbi:mycofactocin biosynthesis chaperone MftB [Candidatus Formimonas warabiya]|uniref:Mycofactocin system protein MftB n=1 Tax=Formimonas warabiya TaxID=1761012 RepID=A0A3G1KR25_FORW1|nr:mycofactocin biosynthesis chaperone MftB [Candidatus Formimonas warabiya]ATW24923.1 mycofactocin system protein MftB [Candidatus Formimonas warabiya]